MVNVFHKFDMIFLILRHFEKDLPLFLNNMDCINKSLEIDVLLHGNHNKGCKNINNCGFILMFLT